MPETLPTRASLTWLRKTAKLQLREWRAQGRDAKLADAQLAIARQYGFPSWRGLKAHVDQLRGLLSSAPSQTGDEPAPGFLRAVGEGRQVAPHQVFDIGQDRRDALTMVVGVQPDRIEGDARLRRGL